MLPVNFPVKQDPPSLHFKMSGFESADGDKPPTFDAEPRSLRSIPLQAPGEAAAQFALNKFKLGVAEPMAFSLGVHPEQLVGEVFLSNYYIDELHTCGWQTKRAGCYSYYQDGRFSKDPDFVPVFVQASELQLHGREVRRHRVVSGVTAP